MNKKEIIKRIDGNGEPYTFEVPRILIIDKYINDTALKWIFENTGLNFVKQNWGGYEAAPITALQIATLFCVYNFNTHYYGEYENKLYLKFNNDEFI